MWYRWESERLCSAATASSKTEKRLPSFGKAGGGKQIVTHMGEVIDLKKLIAILLCAAALITPVMAAGNSDEELVVGTTTPMTGAFATDAWSLNAADMDVRDLIHGYELSGWDSAKSTYVMNPTVVKDFTALSTAGAHSYTIRLYEDLKWSDGTKITAWDYAFSILLSSAPEIAELGGSNGGFSQIKGVQAYSEGRANGISGVTVPNDYTLKITMTKEYDPHFFYLGLFNIKPYPISEIAPGCTVKNGEQGIYISGEFTKAALETNLVNGYATNPKIVSGPYKLVKYDANALEASFEINPNFKGDLNGDKPSIQKITFRYIPSEKVAEEVKNGSVDLMNRVTLAESIEALKQGTSVQSVAYPRAGLSFISFCCEQKPVSTAEVRQAIAYCFDRDAFAKAIVGNYGEVPGGFYGKGQWMVQLMNGTKAAPSDMPVAKLNQLRKLNLGQITDYPFDTAKAAELLDRYGWRLDSDGIRYKNDVKLELELAYPEGSSVADVFPTTLVDNLKEVGIVLTLKAVKSEELLRQYYRQDERSCDMIYMATNFNTVYDPAENFALDEAHQTVYNRTALMDGTLYSMAEQLRKTIPGDLTEYCRRWLRFEDYLMKQLPMIPAYTNDYYDYYVSGLKGYNITSYMTWAKAIVAATME